MNKKKLIIFRVDGGKVWGISSGHIKRSTILASDLKDQFDILFVMKNYQDGTDLIRKHNFCVLTINVDDEYDETFIDICKNYSPIMVIFDLYHNPYSSFFKYARNNNIITIVFDILGRFTGSANAIINDSFVSTFISYPDNQAATKLYLGPKYFMLPKSPASSPLNNMVNNIMITMGGSDPAGLTVKIINSLKDNEYDFGINVILGPLFQDKESIYELIKQINVAKIIANPPDLMDIINNQDFVICSAGRTLYECAYLGRPIIIAPTIEHEEVTAAAYSQKTGCINIGIWDERLSPRRLREAVKEYANDLPMRQAISSAGKHIVDKFGNKRVLNIIKSYICRCT
jgi:UDP-2,4-diacetamido-2,4,6-trideoxy-beta-L-altropyranose hydrolase